MKRLASLGCAALAAACASDAPPRSASPGLPLQNPGFEEAGPVDACPPGWSCIVHNGVHSHRLRYEARAPGAGRRSFCAEPLQPKDNWVFVYQKLPAEPLRGARLRFSALVRADADPGPGAGPSVAVIGGDGYTLALEKQLVRDTGGWRRLTADLTVPPNAFEVQAGFLFQSHALACADDARLEILPPG